MNNNTIHSDFTCWKCTDHIIVTRYWKTDQYIMHEINRISKFKHLTLLKYFQSLYGN